MTLRGQDQTIEVGLQRTTVGPPPRGSKTAVGTHDDDITRIALYLRTSTDDQLQNRTIESQLMALEDAIAASGPKGTVAGIFKDDGVSGTIPMEKRAAGAKLLELCAAGGVDQVWVVWLNRLGRTSINVLRAYEQLEQFGVELVAIKEPFHGKFMLSIYAAVAEEDRRALLEKFEMGTTRAAREGRYTGGIVPFGYMTFGERPHTRLVPSDRAVWGALTEADVVGRIYNHLALDHWSCQRIAKELNALGVPTSYSLAGRGVRGKATQGKWRAGRIRNLVINTIYRGELQYGRRTTRKREIITASVEPLVSTEIWNGAQATLKLNRLVAKNTTRAYLLRTLIKCGRCGLSFCGSAGRPGIWWYRCNGYLIGRGPFEERCAAKSIRGDWLEAVIWADVERFLTEPLAVLDELRAELLDDSPNAVAEAELVVLEERLRELAEERRTAIRIQIRSRRQEDLDVIHAEMERIAAEERTVQDRLDGLRAVRVQRVAPPVSGDLLDEIRERVGTGLTDDQRREIVRLLVDFVLVDTEVLGLGRCNKRATITIHYRFTPPAAGAAGVVPTPTDIRAGQNYTTARRVLVVP